MIKLCQVLVAQGYFIYMGTNEMYTDCPLRIIKALCANENLQLECIQLSEKFVKVRNPPKVTETFKPGPYEACN